MAENQGQPEGNQAPKTESFQIPEKFAGKSIEDVAKSYVELERNYSKAAEAQKALEAYSKIGPADQLGEAINWSRNTFQELQKAGMIGPNGELRISKSAPKPETKPEGSSTSAPWDDDSWNYKTPQEHAKALAEYQQAQVKAYVDQVAGEYGKQIQSLAGRDQREKSILLRTIKSALKTGQDPEEILNKTSELAGKSAEELMDLYLESLNHSPEALEKTIAEKVATAVANARQEWEAKQQDDLLKQSTPPKPRLKALQSTTREEENRAIFQKLAKDGIRFS